jgi:hypothetical protein
MTLLLQQALSFQALGPSGEFCLLQCTLALQTAPNNQGVVEVLVHTADKATLLSNIVATAWTASAVTCSSSAIL